MSGANKIEELECWKLARELVKDVYAVTANGTFSKDFGLRDQIRRSSVSIMANVAEGFGSSYRKEFSRFLSVAVGSAFEVQSHMYVAKDLHYVNENEFDNIYELLKGCIGTCRGLIKHLKKL